MEIYPSINAPISKEPVYVFDKLDGSNIRAEWTSKRGFGKYGTRQRLLDPNEPLLGEAVSLFEAKYADDLAAVFKQARYERATAFLEFHGPHSFAGFHEPEPHTVTLFDVHVYRKGMLPPKEFLRLTRGLDTAALLYEGRFNHEIAQAVRDSTLPGMTFEGVVAKGGYDNRDRRIMFKMKSYAWLHRLKDKYGENSKLYNELL